MRLHINAGALEMYFRTIIERNAIYVRKEILNLPAPWTTDKCFGAYRFCNVHRCLDKTFRLLEQLPGDKRTNEYWAFRGMLRWTANNELIEYLLKNKAETLYAASVSREAVNALIKWVVYTYCEDWGNALTTSSFIVKRPGGPEGDVYMLTSYYEGILELQPANWVAGKRTIKTACKLLEGKLPWCGSFTAYCIASDMMYVPYALCNASDRYTYASRGPGGVRGLSVIISRKDERVSSDEWEKGIPYLVNYWSSIADVLCAELDTSIGQRCISNMTIEQKAAYANVKELMSNPIALDVEHWLCEFFKYYRGSAKKRYTFKEVHK